MTQRLLVKEAFGEYEPGDRITDAKDIKRVTASHPDYVLREHVSEPKAEAKPKEKAKPGRKAAADKAPVVTKNVTIQDAPPPGSAGKA